MSRSRSAASGRPDRSVSVVGRRCSARTAAGRPCRANPLTDVPFCFWHAPRTAEEAIEASRRGGLRRKAERSLADAYRFEGLGDVESARRAYELVVFEALAMERTPARLRVIVSAVQAAARLPNIDDVMARLEALEALTKGSSAPAGLDFPEPTHDDRDGEAA